MSKDIDVKELLPIIKKILAWFERHARIIGIVCVALMYGFLVLQINLLNRKEPTETQVAEQIKNIKLPNIDKQTAEKLKDLEDNSQEVKALFEAARENPFQE